MRCQVFRVETHLVGKPQPHLNALIREGLHGARNRLRQRVGDVRKLDPSGHDGGYEDGTRRLQVLDGRELGVVVARRRLDLRVPAVRAALPAELLVDGGDGALVGVVGDPAERDAVLALEEVGAGRDAQVPSAGSCAVPA